MNVRVVTYPVRRHGLDGGSASGHISFMALTRKKAITIALDSEADRLLTRPARERGVSRSDLIRQQLGLVLEQYRRHPKPRNAEGVRSDASDSPDRSVYALTSDLAGILNGPRKPATSAQRRLSKR